MTPLLILVVCSVMVATSFLSGIFGMAGGMILVGVLLAIMPVPEAMALHGITQIASNGWRAALWWRHVQWRVVAVFVVGSGLALAVWSIWLFVPSKPMALLFLGVTPFLARLVPEGRRLTPEKKTHCVAMGATCMSLLLMTGVAGPLLDQFFLGGSLERRQIIATKGICQIVGHGIKLLYFSALIDQVGTVDPLVAVLAVAAAMTGTLLSKKVLEAMSDTQYRRWAGHLITAISGYYVLQGSYLMVTS
ncbi:sulfite exporter TauE/SafE family protein [Thalassobaculum sp.]|uniref:sulfite exporter TauE/SafE family protein n=1 Tax=Thalassobaculum sp. TaxID=2022740 RepID=UPI0032EF5A75